jgi:hypothetical protein
LVVRKRGSLCGERRGLQGAYVVAVVLAHQVSGLGSDNFVLAVLEIVQRLQPVLFLYQQSTLQGTSKSTEIRYQRRRSRSFWVDRGEMGVAPQGGD